MYQKFWEEMSCEEAKDAGLYFVDVEGCVKV